MNAIAMQESPPVGLVTALSAIKRFHDDYWTLVRTLEASINRQGYAEAELILTSLGSALRSAYHFRQQAARLHLANGQWNRVVEACEELSRTVADDPITVGLWICALSEVRNFARGFRLILETPPSALTADWALERIFTIFAHQNTGEIDPLPAIKHAAEGKPNPALWAARMMRLAGLSGPAERVLKALLRKKPHPLEAKIELALTRLATPGWHLCLDDYKQLAANADVPDDVQVRLRRAISLNALLRSAYAAGTRGKHDFHLPDSFLEVTFERTCNPHYMPEEGRVALVGATMAAGGAERVLGNAFVGLSQSDACRPELWLYSRNASMQHDFFLKELEIDTRHADACFDVSFSNPAEPFSILPDGLSHNAYGVYSMVQKRRPAILHAWQDTTNLECAFAGIVAGVPKIILHPHNMRPDLVLKAPISHSLRRGYRALLQRPDVHAIFVSDASRRDYLSWLELDAAERCHVVYNGFDWLAEPSPKVLRARRAEVRRELGIAEDSTVIGGVFRFHKLKRPKLWLDVAKALHAEDPSRVFVLFGDGPELEDSIAYAKVLGISSAVIFAGRVKGADQKVVGLDMLLHTSETEGLPTVLIEAQGAGVPVVAYATGGVAETAHADLSQLCARDGVEDFVKAARSVLSRRTSQVAARAAARDIRQRFSRETMVRRIEEIYRL